MPCFYVGLESKSVISRRRDQGAMRQIRPPVQIAAGRLRSSVSGNSGWGVTPTPGCKANRPGPFNRLSRNPRPLQSPSPRRPYPPHHYQFTIFAVDVPKLDGGENTTAAVSASCSTSITGLWSR
jgi:phosphatidylethanolamine-binding protein (PEBP) family uncharacterized protein